VKPARLLKNAAPDLISQLLPGKPGQSNWWFQGFQPVGDLVPDETGGYIRMRAIR
jgi:hypothetical protein